MLPQGLMLLPTPWMCHRTWRPRRGPVKTLLKDERSGQFTWLTGGQAALWETLEQGTTLARLRHQAAPLGLDESLPDLIHRWLRLGRLHGLTGRQTKRERGPLNALQPIANSDEIGESTTEEAARTWLTAQGYPFEADWSLAQLDPSAREAMDRLDFLRESGVFQIRFVNGPLQAHSTQRIWLAARAQGFSVIHD